MRRWLLAAAMLVFALGSQRNGAAAEETRFAPLFAALSVCEIFNLTPNGYLRAAPSEFYVETWDRPRVDALVRDARRRPPFKIDLRSTVHLQIASASSYQAAKAFAALSAFMRETGLRTISRSELLAAAAAAYRDRLVAGGYEACFAVKWGNRYPDVFGQPMRKTTWAAIRALFVDRRPDNYPHKASEAAAVASGELTDAEILELRAIRIAAYLFENEFAVLKQDKGGFGGNLADQPLVCTDEATTLWFLVQRLERRGLLTRFATQDGRFVHRHPNLVLPTDHFGLLLRNLRTGAYFVVDSWVEDGGLPPHISRIEDWFDRNERRSIASIGDPVLDDALENGRITHEDKDGLLTRLRDHLAPYGPPDQPPRADGRPPVCGFHWCDLTPSEALRATW